MNVRASLTAFFFTSLVSLPTNALAQESGVPTPVKPNKVSAELSMAAYLWAPSVGGSVTVQGMTADLDVSVKDVFNATDHVYGFMGQAELNINRFLVLLDPTWLHLEKDDAIPGAPTPTDVSQDMLWFDIDAGYRFIDHAPLGDGEKAPRITVDGLVGVRVTGFKFQLSPAGEESVSSRQNWADPLIGARVTFDLGDHFGMVLRGDVGGTSFGSDFSSGLAGILGYRFPIGSANGTVFLGYRAIYQDYEDGDFEWRGWVHGPMIGFQIAF